MMLSEGESDHSDVKQSVVVVVVNFNQLKGLNFSYSLRASIFNSNSYVKQWHLWNWNDAKGLLSVDKWRWEENADRSAELSKSQEASRTLQISKPGQ